jgi:hypothetical protein
MGGLRDQIARQRVVRVEGATKLFLQGAITVVCQ